LAGKLFLPLDTDFLAASRKKRNCEAVKKVLFFRCPEIQIPGKRSARLKKGCYQCDQILRDFEKCPSSAKAQNNETILSNLQ
jgi:hypothetical protein